MKNPKDNEVYLYITDMHSRILGMHDKYTPLKVCNAFYAVSNDITLTRSQPEDLVKHINKLNHFDLDILTDTIEELSLEDMVELLPLFEKNDRDERVYPYYTALSSEYIFLNAVQRHVQPNSNELTWVLEEKMRIALRLLTEPSPLKDGKMGLHRETAQVIASISGFETDNSDKAIQKTREVFSIRVLNAMNKLSHALEHNDSVDEEFMPTTEESASITVNYPETFFDRCRYYNDSSFTANDDPYATLDEQKKVIQTLMQFSQNLRNSPQAIFSGSVNRTMTKIKTNIANNQHRVSSTLHFNMS